MVFALVAPLEGEERQDLLGRLGQLPTTTAAASRAAHFLGQAV